MVHWLARSGSWLLLTVWQSECIALVCDHSSLPMLCPQFYLSSANSMWQDAGLLCLPWYDQSHTSKLILYCWWQSCAEFSSYYGHCYLSYQPEFFLEVSWWYMNSLHCHSTELLVVIVSFVCYFNDQKHQQILWSQSVPVISFSSLHSQTFRHSHIIKINPSEHEKCKDHHLQLQLPFHDDSLVGSTGICSISLLLPAEKGAKDLNRNNIGR